MSAGDDGAVSARPAAKGSRANWGREDDPDGAVTRILDAAAIVFAAKGVTATRLADVADAAGCARGTVYRYFPDRDALRRAFVEREAGRVGAEVLRALSSRGADEPATRLVEAIVIAVRQVRADPVLAEWFDPSSAATAGDIATRTPVIADLVRVFLTDLFAEAERRGALRDGVDPDLAVDWVIRVVLSLLMQPAPGHPRAAARAERAQLEAFLVPALLDD